uniref:NADH-ubiquinone oxidoreductase chain 6 n=1 Tax=Rhyacophila quadrifida TaxID=2904903 RepID=A0A9E8LPC9_9NEOP|nr:NADH dehydrogenase subunit 6 [Rhyacophila quadrifida]UZZ44374.1 NADH dehydrogenase subunit 6 [Rhyacophila quadrifida]
MIMFTVISYMYMLSIMLIFMNNPLSMGILVMIQTLMISLIFFLSNYSSWFAYILFLTFLGGLLILFIYTTSFSSNEKFNFNFNEIILFFMFNAIWIILMMILPSKFPHLIKYFSNLEMNKMNMINLFFNNENLTNNSQLYNSKFILTLMMIMFLLISMTIINKISNPFMGTFRIM